MPGVQDAIGPPDSTNDVELAKAPGPPSSSGHECRICLTSDNQHDIVEPCACTGSVQYAHLECLRSWCMNNRSLKCEICGSVYKDSVVDSLMGTLIEAQDRQVAAQGLSGEEGIRLEFLDVAARQRDNAHPSAAAGQQAELDPEAAAEAQQRMQAFLEELLQLYATRSEAMLASTNRVAFQPEPQFQAQPRRTTAAYTCAAAALLMWMLLFVIISRLFTQVYVRNTVVALGSIVLLIFAVWYFRAKCNTSTRGEAPDVLFGRRAREAERERQLRYAQQNIDHPPIIRVIR